MRHALSVKQPWAALLVAGLKTIEIRRWTTRFRGPLLLHAARVADERPQAWACLPEHLREAARLEGGIVGLATLSSIKPYHSIEEFVADRALHLNDPSWFEPDKLVGFTFTEARSLPFRRVPGYVRIFEVELDDLALPEISTQQMRGVPERFRRLSRSLKKEK